MASNRSDSVTVETSLHQQLKLHYAADQSQTEVVMGRYRIDAIRDDELIEIQCASLSAIKPKIKALVKRHRVRVVKPIVMRTRIAKKKTAKGKIHTRRMSPKRGCVLDLFEDLIYFTKVFPSENLTLEIALVHVEQVRVPDRTRRRRRWQKDYRVEDVKLESIESSIELQTAADLYQLIGLDPSRTPFTTEDIAQATGRPRWFAQKIAYVLKHTTAIQPIGRNRSGILYRAA
ncbi:hypothetical protein NHH03_27075 [Stieleria sp. TO1_6]|uniref:hypothetical protein n=1 Tax=Stieleria tagensis TaxID=2956795 RepID=UPI00209B9663|nr:hypothetical protein [Stieleria tagensis]MCO8125431.1 hypothetical protein [Stieleria tagensis]